MAINFTGLPLSGPTPLTVNFTDTTTPVPTNWDWDFGDLSPHSNLQNPSHIYSAPGVFDVTLLITNLSYFGHLGTRYALFVDTLGDLYARDQSATKGIIKVYNDAGVPWGNQTTKVNTATYAGVMASMYDNKNRTDEFFFTSGVAGNLYRMSKVGVLYGASFSPVDSAAIGYDKNDSTVVVSSLGLYKLDRNMNIIDTMFGAPAADAVTIMDDGRVVIYNKTGPVTGNIYLYATFLSFSAPIATYAVSSDAGPYFWMDNNGTNEIYLSGAGFMDRQVIGGAYTHRGAIDVKQLSYSGGWVYYEEDGPGGLLYRYNWATGITESWDGIDATELKAAYITTTPGGPTPDDLMRCRKWFSGGTFQGCYIG